MGIKKYTFNQARATMGEVGNASSWLISFEMVSGSSMTNISSLNLIAGKFFPAIDVDYNQIDVQKKELKIGPDLEVNIPTHCANITSIKIQFYDTDKKKIRTALRDWVIHKTSLTSNRQAPADLKDIALKLVVYHIDKKELEEISGLTEKFYIVPDGTIDFHGDGSFNLDSLPITFNIVGTE